jgi:hypothetical protein
VLSFQEKMTSLSSLTAFPPCILERLYLSSRPAAVLFSEKHVLILIALKRRVNIDKVNAFGLQSSQYL